MGAFRIKGAGPAGLTAAIALARGGAEVDVFERREDCGTRFHGDLQGVENWLNGRDFLEELEEWGIQPTFQARPFRKATGIDDRGRTYALEGDANLFYVIQRGTEPESLDVSLKTQALDAGVQIHWECPVADSEVDLVTTGPIGKPRRGLAVSEVFKTEYEDAAYVILDNAVASRGYAYLLIVDGQACISSILFADFKSARTQLDRAKAVITRETQLTFQDAVTCGGSTTYSDSLQFSQAAKTPVFYAGEAANLQDPLWGFGVRYAMASGYLAAQGLLGKLDFPVEAEQEFGSQVRAGIVNRYLWESLGHPGYRLIFATAARSGNLRRYLHRLCAPTLAHRSLFPLARRRLRQNDALLSTDSSLNSTAADLLKLP